ncbi:hypothetical protein KTS45_06485 [Halomicroarcula limicola]|uniref:Uncharacterized protein n=1 Tax=Haloarcula limicola TaxID=1429915 RepID=A0A8J8C338_9EURY|nr:hypothetical protein [Halomicroarcula limicola]MBV0923847.1 hypothetical protein [Halomicroarcula limicola]
MALRTLLVCLLVFTAGCAMPAPGDGTGEAATDDGAQTAAPRPTPTPAPAADRTATVTGAVPATTADVDLALYTDSPVRLTVEELGTDGRGVVADRNYTTVTSPEFNENESVFVAERDYRVAIRVGGETRWNRTVRHYEIYELAVQRNGTVEIQSHAVV